MKHNTAGIRFSYIHQIELCVIHVDRCVNSKHANTNYLENLIILAIPSSILVVRGIRRHRYDFTDTPRTCIFTL